MSRAERDLTTAEGLIMELFNPDANAATLFNGLDHHRLSYLSTKPLRKADQECWPVEPLHMKQGYGYIVTLVRDARGVLRYCLFAQDKYRDELTVYKTIVERNREAAGWQS